MVMVMVVVMVMVMVIGNLVAWEVTEARWSRRWTRQF